jgi:glycosyltransferase 2 family protein
VALWQFDKESVLAGLLLFRLLYYIIPFALALTILGSREIWLNVSGARRPSGPAGIPSLAEPIRSEIESEKTDAG